MTDTFEAAHKNCVAYEQLDEQLDAGRISLADYLGLSSQNLYQIADYGYDLLLVGQLEEAMYIYCGLIAAAPADAGFHCVLANIYKMRRNFAAAFAEFNAVLALESANIDALAGRGEVLVLLNRRDEAIPNLRRAIELSREDGRPSATRAKAILAALESAPTKTSS